MKRIACLGLLLGIVVGRAYSEGIPPVTMSAKMITPLVPSISFTISNPGHDIARTRVFTMTGQEIAELSAESVSKFTWDGKDVDEQDVDPGLYVVQIEHNGAFWHGPVIVQR
jgi:hypothetical protein